MSLDKFIDVLIDLPKKISDKLKPDESLSARVERYEDLAGVSTKELNTGLWYVKKTKTMFLVVVWTLVVVAGVLWSYVLYYFGYYLFVGLKQDRQTYAELSEPVDVVRVDFKANLKIGAAQALAWGDDHYDLVGELENRNTNSWGYFSYYFLIDGQRYGNSNGFILPNEKKFLTAFNQNITAAPVNVSLVVENFGWFRINLHQIPDWEAYKKERSNFAVRDKLFSSAADSGLTENVELNRLTFTLTNQTSYNFRQAPFLILMYSQDEIVGVNRYIVTDFAPRQDKVVNLTIVGDLPKVTNVEVVPDINILDGSIYGQL
jgi:hypothetical protein